MEFLSCEISNAVREAVVALNIPRYRSHVIKLWLNVFNCLECVQFVLIHCPCVLTSLFMTPNYLTKYEFRFKVVVQTVIGQMKDQGIRVASRCLWDTSTDNYACCEYKNQELFCNVMIFAMYTD